MGRRKKRQFPGSPQRRRGLPGRTQNCRKFHAQRRHPALLFCGFARMRRCMGRGLRGYWVFPAMKYTGFSARSRRVLRPYQVKAFPLRRKQQPAAVAVRPLRRGNNNNNANKQATALQAEHVHAATHAGQNGRQPPDERESTPRRCRSACVRPCPAMRQATPAPPSPPGPRTQSARLPDGETRSPGWPSSPILTSPYLTPNRLPSPHSWRAPHGATALHGICRHGIPVTGLSCRTQWLTLRRVGPFPPPRYLFQWAQPPAPPSFCFTESR